MRMMIIHIGVVVGGQAAQRLVREAALAVADLHAQVGRAHAGVAAAEAELIAEAMPELAGSGPAQGVLPL